MSGDTRDMRIDAMLSERSNLHQTIMLLEKGHEHAVAMFAAVLATAAGIYWSEKTLLFGEARWSLLLVLTQVEVFLLLYVLSHTTNMAVHAAYIGALERRINQFFDEKVGIWESEISPNHLWRPSRAFFWSGAGMVLLSLGFFAFIVLVLSKQIGCAVLSVGLILEIVVVAVIAVGARIQTRHLKLKIDETFGRSLKPRLKNPSGEE